MGAEEGDGVVVDGSVLAIAAAAAVAALLVDDVETSDGVVVAGAGGGSDVLGSDGCVVEVGCSGCGGATW